MTQSDDNTPQSQQSAPSEGGSSDGEGRNRRRRRRGGGGGGRRPDGQAQEPREPGQAAEDDRPSVRHADTRTSDRQADRPIDRQADRPADQSSEPRSDSQPSGEAEGDRKRKRRRNKKRPADGETSPPAEQRPAQDAQQQSSQPAQGPQAPRGRQGDRKRPEPGEKKERAPRGSVLQRRVTRGEYNDAPVQKEEPTVVAPINAINVDGYISHHKGWQREVLTTLRSIIQSAGGQIEEGILWSQPVYSANGPVCYLKAFTDHVNFGFWRGTELDDPESLLVGEMTKMRHVTLQSVNDIKRDLFEAMVRQAVRLNRDKGDPTLS